MTCHTNLMNLDILLSKIYLSGLRKIASESAKYPWQAVFRYGVRKWINLDVTDTLHFLLWFFPHSISQVCFCFTDSFARVRCRLEIEQLLIKKLQKVHVLSRFVNFSLPTPTLFFILNGTLKKPTLKWLLGEQKMVWIHEF